MPAKFIFVTELHSDKTRAGKDYTYLLDQDKTRWNLFNGERVELKKGYVFDYEVSGEYCNVKEIKPVINIFQQKALAEIANKNDYIKNLSYSMTQAIQVWAIGGKMPQEAELFSTAWSIYNWIDTKASSLMPKEETK